MNSLGKKEGDGMNFTWLNDATFETLLITANVIILGGLVMWWLILHYQIVHAARIEALEKEWRP